MMGATLLKNILCFGDSNTWGYAPVTGERYPGHVRWTGVLQSCLGDDYLVIEEGLNGRTTVHNESLRPHRNGAFLLPVLLESHSPLDLVIVMLGTNDLKACFRQSALEISQGAKKVCQEVIECEFLSPGSTEILLISPSHVDELPAEDHQEFDGAMEKSRAFSAHYKEVADELGIHFFDAAQVVRTSVLDGVHWDADQHSVFGKELANFVEEIWTG